MRYILIIIFSIFFQMQLFAQQKYKIIQKENYEAEAWICFANFFTEQRFDKNYQTFIGFDMISFRYKYLHFTLVTLGDGLRGIELNGFEPPNSFINFPTNFKKKYEITYQGFFVPFGLFIPIKVNRFLSLGINVNFKIIPFYKTFKDEFSGYEVSNIYKEEDKNYRRWIEVEGKNPSFIDFDVKFELMGCTFYLGYKKAISDMKIYYKYYQEKIYTSNSNTLLKTQENAINQSGVYLKLSAGASFLVNFTSKFGKWRQKKELVDERLPIPPPILKIDMNTKDNSIECFPNEKKYLKVKISNNGQGPAEGLKLTIKSQDFIILTNEINNSLEIGLITSFGSKEIDIPIRAKPTLNKEVVSKIQIYCTEKDGFKADKSIELKIRPLSKLLQNPPNIYTSLTFQDEDNNGFLDADEKGKLNLRIENKGINDAYSLKILIESNLDFTEGLSQFQKQFIIEELKSNTKEVISIPIQSNINLADGKIDLTARVEEANGFNSVPVYLSITTKRFLPPKLELGKVTIDDSEGINTSGNGDGKIQKRELIEISIEVKNTGGRKAKKTKIKINISDPNIFFGGRSAYELDEIEPGNSKIIKFPFTINDAYSGGQRLPILINIVESYGKFGVDKNLDLKLH